MAKGSAFDNWAPLTEWIDRLSMPDLERVPTGFADLDRVLGGGLARGRLSILGAAPRMGKTSLSVSLGLPAAGTGDAITRTPLRFAGLWCRGRDPHRLLYKPWGQVTAG